MHIKEDNVELFQGSFEYIYNKEEKKRVDSSFSIVKDEETATAAFNNSLKLTDNLCLVVYLSAHISNNWMVASESFLEVGADKIFGKAFSDPTSLRLEGSWRKKIRRVIH